MSDKKIIEIQPELFNFKKKTKKKNMRLGDEGIKIKPNTQSLTTKHRIMKYIRNQQEENYKKMFDPHNTKESHVPMPRELEPLELENKTDFDKTLSYLKTVTDNENQHKHNTIKNSFSNYNANSNINFNENSDINNNIINEMEQYNNIVNQNNEMITLLPNPQYGCLKNGNLPTYRTLNRYNSNYPLDKPSQIQSICPSGFMQTSNPIENIPNTDTCNMEPIQLIENIENTTQYDNLQTRLKADKLIEKKKELLLKLKEEDEINKKKYSEKESEKIKNKTIANKKIIKRVYNLGKSSVVRKVGVLVSSEAYRKGILTKKKTLKQSPFGEVNKYLCDRGLIKAGSSAPEEVLRELYENAELIGNLQNHNVENLLHNYVNG